MKRSSKPYAANRFGHANKCDCTKCAKLAKKKFSNTLNSVAKLDESIARLPTSVTQTVFVRAHFKRHPRHFSDRPRTRQFIRKLLKERL